MLHMSRAPAVSRLDNLSMQTESSLPATNERRCSCYTTAEENRTRQFIAGELATVSKVIDRLVLTRLRPHLLDSTNFSDIQSGLLIGRVILRRAHCWRFWMVSIYEDGAT